MANELELIQKIKDLEYENRLLKITFCTCSHCKHADLYIPHYTQRFFDPRCNITKKQVSANQKACEDFEMFGLTKEVK